MKDLSQDLKFECKSQADTCKTCEWQNCNEKPDFTECYECDGKNDLRCSGNQTTLGKSKICNNYKGSCLTGIDAFGYTHRRCSKDNENEGNEFSTNVHSTYEKCSSKKCNSKIFPKTRVQCYQCNGNRSHNCEMNPDNLYFNTLQAVPCRLYSKDDQCYTYLSEGSIN